MMNKQVQIIYYPIILSMLYTCIFWLKQIINWCNINFDCFKNYFTWTFGILIFSLITKIFCVGVNFFVQEI